MKEAREREEEGECHSEGRGGREGKGGTGILIRVGVRVATGARLLGLPPIMHHPLPRVVSGYGGSCTWEGGGDEEVGILTGVSRRRLQGRPRMAPEIVWTHRNMRGS